MRLIILLLSTFSGLIVSCQSTPSALTFAQIPLSDPDMNRPGAGTEQWIGQNTVNIPDPGINTQRMDAYYRFSYTDIAPYDAPAGTYDFTLFDAKISDAISKGQKFSFCIMQLCGTCYQGGTVSGAHLFYPLYLHQQMQTEAVKDWISDGQWIPNYNSASWLNAWKSMNMALNDHIMKSYALGTDFKKIINYIDVSGYGDYGEWTNNKFDGPPGSIATDQTLTAIIDATVQGYPEFQCVALVATFDGNQLPNTKNSPAVGYYALTTSNKAGKLGWRRDNWGWTDAYNSWWSDANPTVYKGLRFDTAILNRYKYSPIVGEPADLGLANHLGEPFGDLARQIKFYHVSRFGNGNLDKSVGNQAALKNYRAASKIAGYRLVLTSGNINPSIGVGKEFKVSLNWQNLGVSPTYENWNVVFELRDSASGMVVWTDTSSFNPKLFLPSAKSQTKVDVFTLPGSTPAGKYGFYVTIRDPNGYRQPLPLANKGRNADGSYVLLNKIVVD